MTSTIFEYELADHLDIIKHHSNEIYCWESNSSPKVSIFNLSKGNDIYLGCLNKDEIQSYIAQINRSIQDTQTSIKFHLKPVDDGKFEVVYVGSDFFYQSISACSGLNFDATLSYYNEKINSFYLYCNKAGYFWLMKEDRGIAIC